MSIFFDKIKSSVLIKEFIEPMEFNKQIAELLGVYYDILRDKDVHILLKPLAVLIGGPLIIIYAIVCAALHLVMRAAEIAWHIFYLVLSLPFVVTALLSILFLPLSYLYAKCSDNPEVFTKHLQFIKHSFATLIEESFALFANFYLSATSIVQIVETSLHAMIVIPGKALFYPVNSQDQQNKNDDFKLPLSCLLV